MYEGNNHLKIRSIKQIVVFLAEQMPKNEPEAYFHLFPRYGVKTKYVMFSVLKTGPRVFEMLSCVMQLV
jgi:hypothetical protein